MSGKIITELKICKTSFKNLASKALLLMRFWSTPFSVFWKPTIKILKQCWAHRATQVCVSDVPVSRWSKEMLSPRNPRPIPWQRQWTHSRWDGMLRVLHMCGKSWTAVLTFQSVLSIFNHGTSDIILTMAEQLTQYFTFQRWTNLKMFLFPL